MKILQLLVLMGCLYECALANFGCYQTMMGPFIPGPTTKDQEGDRVRSLYQGRRVVISERRGTYLIGVKGRITHISNPNVAYDPDASYAVLISFDEGGSLNQSMSEEQIGRLASD